MSKHAVITASLHKYIRYPSPSKSVSALLKCAMSPLNKPILITFKCRIGLLYDFMLCQYFAHPLIKNSVTTSLLSTFFESWGRFSVYNKFLKAIDNLNFTLYHVNCAVVGIIIQKGNKIFRFSKLAFCIGPHTSLWTILNGLLARYPGSFEIYSAFFPIAQPLHTPYLPFKSSIISLSTRSTGLLHFCSQVCRA